MNFNFLNEFDLSYLKNGFVTIKTMANFYNVSIESIKTIIKRNIELFKNLGYIVLKGKELKNIKNENYKEIDKYCSIIALLNNKCIVCLAYLLPQSEIKYQIISYNMKFNNNFHNELMSISSDEFYMKKYEKELGFLIH